ncbi:hypothetical protein GWI33_019357 [Rhynchophorus ferrugineus]|uniref:Uncharacterized protein n=1 Tax=Rhynchophorus ferrugineus TaxID=354439 RepID=A0A834HT07_RHYFE|nr:hypothetical protein GWI33_019357 [Rhynchophorus ferrugineus]
MMMIPMVVMRVYRCVRLQRLTNTMSPVPAAAVKEPPSYILKRTPVTKTEIDNVIAVNTPDHDTKADQVIHNNNYVTSPELVLIRRQNPQQELTSPKIESTTQKIKLEKLEVDLQVDPNFLPKRSRPGIHKRKSTTKKDSEIKKIILTENSSWMLKTINDQPADEVLVTDRASVAHDLQNSTESALVLVHKLDENT